LRKSKNIDDRSSRNDCESKHTKNSRRNQKKENNDDQNQRRDREDFISLNDHQEFDAEIVNREKKKERHSVDETFAQRRLEAADEHEKDERKNEERSSVDFRHQFIRDDYATNIRRLDA
jgi:hypothetical protein